MSLLTKTNRGWRQLLRCFAQQMKSLVGWRKYVISVILLPWYFRITSTLCHKWFFPDDNYDMTNLRVKVFGMNCLFGFAWPFCFLKINSLCRISRTTIWFICLCYVDKRRTLVRRKFPFEFFANAYFFSTTQNWKCGTHVRVSRVTRVLKVKWNVWITMLSARGIWPIRLGQKGC